MPKFLKIAWKSLVIIAGITLAIQCWFFTDQINHFALIILSLFLISAIVEEIAEMIEISKS